MLNKPIKNSKFAMLTMALIFCLSGFSLFAQNKQANSSISDKKQLPSAQTKVSLSNQGSSVSKQDEATQKRIALKDERKAEKLKKQNIAKEDQMEVKHSKNNQTISSKVYLNQTNMESSKPSSEASNKDWEIKKTKLIQSLKSKNYTQQEIDKVIAKFESKRNNSTNKTTK
jgi:hypothetical protein